MHQTIAPNQLVLDLKPPGRNPRCGDCRRTVSLLPSRRYPQAWSEITVAVGDRQVEVVFCKPCGERRLDRGDVSCQVAA